MSFGYKLRTSIQMEECKSRLNKLSRRRDEGREYRVDVNRDRFYIRRIQYSKFPNNSILACIFEPIFCGRLEDDLLTGNTVIRGYFRLPLLGIIFIAVMMIPLSVVSIAAVELKEYRYLILPGIIICAALAVQHMIWWKITREDTLAYLSRKLMISTV